MTPKHGGLKQHIYFPHSFAEQGSARMLALIHMATLNTTQLDILPRRCITELASWCWLLGPFHVGVSTRWLELPHRMVLGSSTKCPRRQEIKFISFLKPEPRNWTVIPLHSVVQTAQTQIQGAGTSIHLPVAGVSKNFGNTFLSFHNYIFVILFCHSFCHSK